MIKNILLTIYLWIRKQKRQLKWFLELKAIESKEKRSLDVGCLEYGKYLVLIPHSDDEWIGCSTIIENPKYNVVLCNMNMQGGDSSDVHMLRKKEMENTAQRSNRKFILCNNSPELVEIIKKETPTHIVLPYINDWHEEHIQVMKRLYDALMVLNENVEIVMCQITIPITIFNITHCNLMDKRYWEAKWDYFRKNYHTQKNFPWYRVACHERLNGKFVNSFAAEVFCTLPSNKWKSVFEKYLPTKSFQELLLKNMGSLKSIRNINQIIVLDDEKLLK